MIVAIADDLSGAAEIAGIGRRFGLTAQVQRRFSPEDGIDVVVVDTDTRNAGQDVARATVGALARELNDAGMLWCYKKVDSVMRGHVRVELEVLMNMLGKPRTILAPANPSRGRTIIGGQYRINNRPLHETDFADDPQYPIMSSLVTDVLGVSRECAILALRHSDYQGHEKGIVIAEARNRDDLSHWAARIDESTLAAGGADFFSAILQERSDAKLARPASETTGGAGPRLFVCGSASEYSRRAVRRARSLGVPVCPMPDPLLGHIASSAPLIDHWAKDVLDALRAGGQALAAIPQPVVQDAELARKLSGHMAVLVESVVGRTIVKELILEGGATAEAVLARLGWTVLNVLGEYGPGVVRLCMPDRRNLLVTIKPGSYPWPAEIWSQPEGGASYVT